ncbi:MAG: tetratricopeptide repeat protein [Bradymonadaceae bacterium]
MDDRRRRKLLIDWRRGLIPLSLLTLFILHFGFGTPIWVLALLSLWVPLYYLAFPMYLTRTWKEFDRDFTLRFQKQDYKALLKYYRRQRFLRHFGPRSQMLAKLGLIYSGMEKYREAEHAYEQAIGACRVPPSDQLYFNLANVKYELGKYDDALQIYKSLRTNSPYQHSIRTQLALIDLHRGARVEEARTFLEQAQERATGTLRLRIDEALTQHS